MKNLKGSEIRQMWIDFFKSKGHYEEPSASLIPHNDPTLLWINAGVAALKKYFDGREIPEHTRIVNAQKSIRTNDIENVGRTSRHHTFFEMLGNFSIGDYFRKEAITWAFELLTSPKWFDIPVDKLYITHHPSDIETRDLWISLGMNPSHMVPNDDNFWEIGEGPCGPDTEIFFDRGDDYDPLHQGEELIRKDLDNDRYIEMWNIVFSQYNSDPKLQRSEYKELPQKNIDTGASLERFACIFQNVNSNYETDLVYPIIEATEKLANIKYNEQTRMAYRVIADHVRACTFALADGAVFSNEGRGYVLRRLIRRAFRFGKTIGIEKPFLYSLVDTVVKIMISYYPYLEGKKEKVIKMIESEEIKFQKTLASGEKLLLNMLENTSGKVLNGADCFKLADTYGFPLELTEEIAEEKGFNVDKEQFSKLLLEQKERARNARSADQSMGKQSEDLLKFNEKSTYDYVAKSLNAKVIGLFKDGQKVDMLEDEGEIIVDNTNFYATSGGQIYDIGSMENNNTQVDVISVMKAPNGAHLHFVKVNYGEVRVGDSLTLNIDYERRKNIAHNHTSAHILQKALQEVLGEEVHQAGSEVNEKGLRFDFTYFKKMTDDEIKTVEYKVNEIIAKSIEVTTKLYDYKEAKLLGAMSLFDEKYGDKVRVVSVGDYSKEFCAGCHVSNTGEIGIFTIISEESIASGVRRIVATTGFEAFKLFREKDFLLSNVCKELNIVSKKDILTKLKSMKLETQSLKQQRDDLSKKMLNSLADKMMTKIEIQNDKALLVNKVEGLTHDELSNLLSDLKNRNKSLCGLVFNVNKEKIEVSVVVGDELNKNLKAGLLIKELLNELGGHGGGKPDIAFGCIDSLEKIEKGYSVFKRKVLCDE